MKRWTLLALVATVGCGQAADMPGGAADVPLADIRLVVDKLGITHVYAASDHDALWGAGYAQARDRLFHMELNRRRARGTLAQLLGKAFVGEDRKARVIGFARLGAADAARMRSERPAEAALIDAWAAGVNRRLDEVRSGAAPRPYGLAPDQLDFVPERWTIDDAFAVGKVLSFGLSNTLDSEVLASVLLNVAPAALPHLPIMKPAYDTFIAPPEAGGGQGAGDGSARSTLDHVVTPGADLSPASYRRFSPDNGSNNWAVDGTHSANGRPLLAGDPHQGTTSPQNFWPVHMSSTGGGGTLDVIGFVYPGTPVVELGHNARIGWTATTNYADVMDLWDVDVGGFQQVTLGDGAHAIVTRDEELRVRRDGAAYGDDDVTTMQTWEVPGYGVLLNEEILPVPRYYLAKGQVLFNWTGFGATSEAASFLALDRAAGLDDFDRAVDLLEVGAVNFVAADATGIDYRVHARVPDRGDPASHPMPWHILPGTDAQSLWTRGFLPDGKLPRSRAPASGLLYSGNNDPFGFTADGNVQNDPWYYGDFYSMAFRPHRVGEVLAALTAGGKKLTRADMEALQDDVHSSLADTVVPHLTDAVAQLDADPKLAAWKGRADVTDLAARLAAWDRTMKRETEEPVVFVGVAWFAARRAFAQAITGAVFETIGSASPPFLLGALKNLLDGRYPDAAYFVPDGERVILVGALADCADWLRARFGTIGTGGTGAPGEYRYADFNFAAFTNRYGHALDPAPVAISGGSDTVQVAEAGFFQKGAPVDKLTVMEVSLYRMALGFGDDGVPEATIDFARGVREDPADPHFGDRESDWQAGAHVPLPFRKADVEAQATETVTLAKGK